MPQAGTIDLRWVAKMATFVRQRRVDIMHAHEFAMNTYASIVSACTGVPLVATVHGKNYYTERWRRRAAYRFVARHAVMVAVSEDIRTFLQSAAGVDPGRIVVIQNGIDCARFRPDPTRRLDARSELGLSPTQVVLGAIGMHYPVKGHRYLVRAMELVRRHHPDTVLLLAGDGPVRVELERDVARSSLEGNVRFLGFYEDVERLLQALDVFVLPSLSEGLPLALLEAMACGKPVVATAVGGVPEVVSHGATGLLVPPADPEALAASILLLVQDAALSARLGPSARADVERRFGLARMVQRYETLYAGLAKGPTRHARKAKARMEAATEVQGK